MKTSKIFAIGICSLVIALLTSVAALAQDPKGTPQETTDAEMRNGTYVGTDFLLPAFRTASDDNDLTRTLQVHEYSTGGQASAFLAVSGGNIWVTNQNSSCVTKMATNGKISGIFTTGSIPNGVIVANNIVYVANSGDGTITAFSQNGTRLKTINLPSGQSPYQLAYDGKYLWVSGEHEYFYRVNLKTGQLLAVLTRWFPYQLLYDGSSIVGTLLNDELVRINPASGVATLFTITGSSDLTGIAFDGSHYFALDFSGLLIKTDSAFNVLGSVQTGASIANFVYYDPSGGHLWVTGLGTDAVIEVDPNTLVAKTVSLPAGSLDEPLGIAVDGNLVVVANNGPENLGVTVFSKK